jgi:predicted NodU family carbamoyl transferase
MRIIGVNISHDTSVSEIVDGKLVNLYEEERCVREKYYDPNKNILDTYEGLLSIDRYDLGDELVDMVAFASFDRREIAYQLEDSDNMWNNEWVDGFLEDITKTTLSIGRLKELTEKYEEFSYSIPKVSVDDDIVDLIMGEHYPKEQTKFFDENLHHEYHAWSAGYFAYEQDQVENAMCIVWDGGGAQSYFPEYPGYQEIESIYKIEQGVPILKHQVMSNFRVINDLNYALPNRLSDCCQTEVDTTEIIDDAEIVFTSRPSSGMQFSTMSQAFGTDKMGRAAGKVMGMASYGRGESKEFNKHTISQKLELETFEKSCETIQKAIDLDPTNTNIILSGGYSLNCTNNYKYLQRFPDMNFYVEPCCHDGGTAVGVALKVLSNISNDEDYVSPTSNYVKRSVWT